LIRVLVLANGCQDATTSVAKIAAARFPSTTLVEVFDLREAGKSRTWNTFVHNLSRNDADFLVFCDADIRLPQQSVIATLVNFVSSSPGIEAASSLAVKDIDYYPTKLGVVEKAISAGGRITGHNLKTAICGMLYVMRCLSARVLKIPIGLPVEDGFVRHAIITRRFSSPINENLIDQPANVLHIYFSERRIGSLLRHQIRLVIGSAINAALFSYLIRLHGRGGETLVGKELDKASQTPEWLPRVLRGALPTKKTLLAILFAAQLAIHAANFAAGFYFLWYVAARGCAVQFSPISWIILPISSF